MPDKRYEVYVDNNRAAARMKLDDALLFIKALFEKYYYEPLDIRIREEPKTCEDLKGERVLAGVKCKDCKFTGNCRVREVNMEDYACSEFEWKE